MVFSAVTETKTIVKTLPEFKAEAYENISSAELVVFAVYAVQEDGLFAAVEEIVSGCFRLFPHRFSLKSYFYWPDSALVMRCLNEAKEKGDLKDKIGDGFAVKVQGRQTVKQVAKALGVTLPAPVKKKRKPAPVIPAPEKKQAEVAQPVKAQAKKKVEAKKPVTTTAVKKKLVKKKAVKPSVKAEAKKKKLEKAVAPKVKAKTVSRRQAAAPKKVKHVAPSPQPKQLTLIPQVPAEAKKTVKGTATKPQVKKARVEPGRNEARVVKQKKVRAAQIIHKEEKVPAVAIIVSKEEKVKAGKVIHTMERSDAYRQYKRLDGKAKISEFDFRNMLFATMESSAETLKRNVDLFKRYANIHSRADLVVFLDFCETSFAELLKPSMKKVGKRR